MVRVAQSLTLALRGMFLFEQLTSRDLTEVVNAMTERKVAAGETIIQQGVCVCVSLDDRAIEVVAGGVAWLVRAPPPPPHTHTPFVRPVTHLTHVAGDASTATTTGDTGDNFYVVGSGRFDIFIDGIGKVAERLQGSYFGELALLYNSRRSATVTAAEDSVVWVVDRPTFRSMIAKSADDQQALIVSKLRGVPLMQSLSEVQLHALAECVQVAEYEQGDTIIRKGDQGHQFFMIQSGRVRCTDIESGGHTVDDVVLDAGCFFGERALMMDTPRAANVIADTAHVRGGASCCGTWFPGSVVSPWQQAVVVVVVGWLAG